MKTTFTCAHDDIHGKEVTRLVYETKNEVLDDIIDDFTYFLRGCGFMIGDRKLMLVDESVFYNDTSVPDYYDDIIARHDEDYYAD